LADGDILPGSKAFFPIFAGSLLLGCFSFLRNYVRDRTALLGGLLIASMPLFFIHSTIGMANLPFTYYLVLGTLFGLHGFLNNENRYLLMSGLLFALSGWTRPEGIGFGFVMILSLILLALIIWHKRIKFIHLVMLIVPLLIIPGSWYILIGSKSQYKDQIGTSLRESLQQIIQGNLHLDSLKQIFEYGVGYFFSNWNSGYVIIIALIALLASLPFLKWHKNRLSISLIILTLVAALVPASMFYVASFHEADFSAFLDQSFDRAYLPAIILLVITALVTALGKREINIEA
jgi:4-amino-4-deoxy-L-arabinose transferase-like glycosyltransferase